MILSSTESAPSNPPNGVISSYWYRITWYWKKLNVEFLWILLGRRKNKPRKRIKGEEKWKQRGRRYWCNVTRQGSSSSPINLSLFWNICYVNIVICYFLFDIDEYEVKNKMYRCILSFCDFFFEYMASATTILQKKGFEDTQFFLMREASFKRVLLSVRLCVRLSVSLTSFTNL